MRSRRAKGEEIMDGLDSRVKSECRMSREKDPAAKAG
ncbi:UNVERIFIED_ORG: hypothetical protein ABIC48_000577 [Burkholderia territorii]